MWGLSFYAQALEEVFEFYDLAKGSISEYLTELTKDARKETTKRLKENNRQNLSKIDMIGVKRWSEFVEHGFLLTKNRRVCRNCRSICLYRKRKDAVRMGYCTTY